MTDRPFKTFRASRTALLARARRLFRLAALANRADAPPLNEIIAMSWETEMTRRRFLKASAAAALAVGGARLLTACRMVPRPSKDVKVAVVGAGIAGLNAAYRLKKAGVRAAVYEGAKRTGGRIFTADGIMAPGLTTELGGEFINSDHEDMLALAAEFDLPRIDVEAPGEEKLAREAYFFAGGRRTEAQVVDAFRPIAARVALDQKTFAGGLENNPAAAALDRTPLAQYLDEVCGRGWLRAFLDVAYTTEYGLETAEQSALNMLAMISADVSGGAFHVLGDSDERYKILGGNQRIVDALAGRLDGQIRPEHRLEALRPRGPGFTLTFQGPSGTVEADADIVVLAIPFSILREVDLQVELPPLQQRAIAELGYGANAKVMAGYKSRAWRAGGDAGNAFTDQGFQLAWDNSRGQAGDAGGLTFYLGGKTGAASGQGAPEDLAARFAAQADKLFPGSAARRNGQAHRFHWPTHPWTKGSYSCYKPGQWTAFAGAEGRPAGNLFFAGEHCSADFAGFMNGGAATGRLAADAVLAKIGVASL